MNVSEIKGVNLGGWLVLERWITPSVFRGTDAGDEYGLCVALGETARERLEEHRRTFVTEQTIVRIVELGLNTVRLPVGYWLFGGAAPFVDGAKAYVDEVFTWAEKYDVRVILDVHAAPGSQNGWDHSGRAGGIAWHREKRNVEATLEFLAQLCDAYGSQPSLWGIEVLNEPHWDVPMRRLLEYYRQAYGVVREKCPLETTVLFSDAFRPKEMAKQLERMKMENVAVDMHLYQLFTDEDRMLDLGGHIHKAATAWPQLMAEVSSRLPIIVGEWSAAMDESRATYMPDDYWNYASAQISAFESQAAGWVYWTARAEGGGAWSLLDHPDFIRK